jgi:hypothetical protein
MEEDREDREEIFRITGCRAYDTVPGKVIDDDLANPEVDLKLSLQDFKLTAFLYCVMS